MNPTAHKPAIRVALLALVIATNKTVTYDRKKDINDLSQTQRACFYAKKPKSFIDIKRRFL